MLQRLAEFLDLDINLKADQGHYNQPNKARDLPSDELINVSSTGSLRPLSKPLSRREKGFKP